jgi:hypothetical protein
VYLGDNIQADWDDIRITDASNNLLNYCLDPYAPYGENNISIWVKIPSLIHYNNYIRFYYDNPDATSGLSAPGDVFDFYDGFDTEVNWVNWGSTTHALYPVVNGKVWIKEADAASKLLYSLTAYNNVTIDVSMQNNGTKIFFDLMEPVAGTYTGKDACLLNWNTHYYNSSFNQIVTGYPMTVDTTNYYKISYRLPNTGSASARLYLNHDLLITHTGTPTSRTVYPSFLSWTTGASGNIDFIAIHKTAPTVPLDTLWFDYIDCFGNSITIGGGATHTYTY